MIEISSIGSLTALAAGAISFLSPCVLPLVPGYVSYVAGNAAAREPGARERFASARILLLALFFVLGFSTVFVALGASASGLSRLLLGYRYEANLLGGALIILFGIFMTELVPIRRLVREHRFHSVAKGGRPAGAYALGLAFGFGWTPCIGPVLGAILTVSALSSTATSGIALLTLYSAALGIPFLLSAIFMERLTTSLRPLRRTGRVLQLGAGGIMIVMGFAIMTGRLSDFSFWLLDQFPALGSIG